MEKRYLTLICAVALIFFAGIVSAASRVPTIGGDTDNWGTILNNFLNVSLNATGGLREDIGIWKSLRIGEIDSSSDYALEINQSAAAMNVSGMLYVNSSSIGIGTTTPEGVIHTYTLAFASTPLFERGGLTTNTMYGSMRTLSTKTTDMGDGFGSSLYFQIQDNAGAGNSIGAIGAVRAGADGTGDIIIAPAVGGTPAEKMRITSTGFVGIGTTAPSYKLEIANNETAMNISGMLYVNSSGIGFGTKDPGANIRFHSYSTLNSANLFIIDTAGTQSTQQVALNLLTKGTGSLGLGAAQTKGWGFYARGDAFSVTATQNEMQLFYWTGAAYLNAMNFLPNGNIGVGAITAPAYLLEIAKNETALNVSGMLYVNSTNVGIGGIAASNSRYMLHVNGTSLLNGSTILVRTSDNGAILKLCNGGEAYCFNFNRSNTLGVLQIQGSQTGYNNISLAPTSGNVGIRTDTPSMTLEVAGNVTVEEMINLQVRTLPACGIMYNGSIMRNDSGIYGCNSTQSWVFLF